MSVEGCSLLGKVSLRPNNSVMQWVSAIRMLKVALNATVRALDDKALIEMTLAGHNECFDVLMDRHLYVMRKRVDSMIRNKAEAEDVLQVAQLKVWTHLSTFRCDSSFRTWISRIAINEVLQSYRRTRMVREWGAMDFDRLAASMDCPERLYSRLEMAGKISRAICRLPAKFRRIVVLRDLRELSIKEAACELKSTPQLVKTHLFRARMMLSRVLQATAIGDEVKLAWRSKQSRDRMALYK
jgi:RNA polymerase sigma-70 factor, ECF subfamily